jgi:putative OPT family oligopeptide transporter
MSPTTSKLELTPLSIILGLVLSVIMAAANVYLGLKAGMTVSASIPAAVVAMLFLRFFFRGSSILQANQVQTTASAGESLAAGIIFTMPALILIGAWKEFDMVMTTVIAFTGGLLGILFMIPMRRVFVVNNDELKFPEGVACAAVLEAGDVHSEDVGDADRPSAIPVILGGLIGVGFKALISFFGIFKGTLEGAQILGSRILYFGSDISPALLGVGIIVRLNVAVLIFIGGALGWLIGIPLLDGSEHVANPTDGAWALWSTKIRYVGVGAMVVGGAESILRVRHGLLDAIKVLRERFSPGATRVTDEKDRDLPTAAILGLITLATISVFGVYFVFTKSVGVTIVTTIIMIIMSFFFTAVASYIVGLVGNSNSPVSGMTITAVLFTGLILTIFNFTGETGMIATLGVAAIVCCAACTSGDVCNDLKTGALVGATPYKQQIMQVAGVAVASLVMAPVLQLLHNNTPGGIGGKELSAPQASLFASLAKGFFGDGQLPWDLVGVGAVIGVVIALLDRLLETRKSKFRMHLMPVAVGMYLPFGLAVPILMGGLIAHFLGMGAKDEADEDRKLQRGVLFSSGIIAGESLTGVGLAILAAAGIGKLALDIPSVLSTVLTLVASIAVVVGAVMISRPKR